ncbi:MAG: allophanate hydrolase, partial [Mycobacterium sp.]|nr:allophanate hydrolase [Mycobacterium sp.]
RFAAPDSAVIGVAATVPGEVRATLSGAGWVVAADRGDLHGADALITDGLPPVPDGECAVTVTVDGSVLTVRCRAFDDAVALDVAATLTGTQAVDAVWPLSGAGHVELVVFGAHLRGGPLTHQLTELGSRWAGEITTAPRYRMTVLPTSPAKPAITRVPDDASGAALYGHRWLMSAAALGEFLSALPAPMQLGKVEFADGSWRTGFGCDAAAATGPDISAYGSWPAAVAAGAVSFSRRSARPVHGPD